MKVLALYDYPPSPAGSATQGQDWQTRSAAMYLYAAHCVQTRATTFFDRCRET